MSAALPLVSVLIPAYRERFFAEALGSALAQGYPVLEVVVCDDSEGDAIARITGNASDPRVRYVRNPSRLGFAGNFTRCLREARGEYLKFLNDDDRLHPGCVETLASILRLNGAVSLATSRRTVIDAAGAPLPDLEATAPISHLSALFLGHELGDFALANAVNFIGEPSTVMFRARDLEVEGDTIFRWGAHEYHCLADLSLWLRLLHKGLAFYCALPLSDFRVHHGQEQHLEEVRLECVFERLWIAREARRHGFLASPSLWAAALERTQARVDACRPQLMSADHRLRFDAFRRELAIERGTAAV